MRQDKCEYCYVLSHSMQDKFNYNRSFPCILIWGNPMRNNSGGGGGVAQSYRRALTSKYDECVTAVGTNTQPRN